MPTINEEVVAGADDGSSALGGGPYLTLNTIQLYHTGSGANRYAGFRFQTINIAAGSTIDSATLTVQVLFSQASAFWFIYGNDVDDAGAWGTTNRIKDISKTAAKANIDTSDPSTNDVTAIVQEIVDRGGWSANNDMAFEFGNFSAGAGSVFMSLAAYEAGGGNIPLLDITYTEGGGGGTPVPVFYYHLQQQGIA